MTLTQSDEPPTSTALEVVEVGGATITPLPAAPEPMNQVTAAVATLGAKLEYARAMALSSLIPQSLVVRRGANVDLEATAANVLVCMEYGQVLDLAPVTAMSEIHVLKGKPGCSVKLMRAQVRRAGHKVRILEHTSERATVQIELADDPGGSVPFTFTLEDAETAGLCKIKDGKAFARSKSGDVLPWEAYTSTLLLERATGNAVRGTCPEVLMGVSYTIEELHSMVDVHEAPSSTDGDHDEWASDEQISAIQDLGKQLDQGRKDAADFWCEKNGINKRAPTASQANDLISRLTFLLEGPDLATKSDIDHIRSTVAKLTADQLVSWNGYLDALSLDHDQTMTGAEAADLFAFLAALVNDDGLPAEPEFDVDPEPEPDAPADRPMNRIERAEFRAHIGQHLRPPPEVSSSKRGAWANQKILDLAAAVTGRPVATVDQITVSEAAAIVHAAQTGEVPDASA